MTKKKADVRALFDFDQPSEAMSETPVVVETAEPDALVDDDSAERVDEIYDGDVPEEVVVVAVAPSPPPEPVTFEGQQFLGDMFSPEDLEQIRAEQVFQRVDLDLETQYRCPACAYEWSGNPKPTLKDAEAELNG